MSHESGNSSGSSGARAIGRVVGIPKRCWCGEFVVSLISKSTVNPYKRYYRCAFAAEKRLSNDNHVYKWVDEALVDEIEALTLRIGKLEQKTNLDECVEEEKKRFAAFEMKLETELFLRMEDAISEAKWEMKKVMGFVLWSFLMGIVVLMVSFMLLRICFVKFALLKT